MTEIVFVPGDIASAGGSGAAGSGCRRDGTAAARNRACGGRDRRRTREPQLPRKASNECGHPRWPAPCGCTPATAHPASSTGGLASRPWPPFWVCRVNWRTQPPNAWLDALMAWRRASGMPATAINWGQWSDVGMSRSLTYTVLDPITPDEGIEALDSLVGGKLTRVGVGRLRLDRAARRGPRVP